MAEQGPDPRRLTKAVYLKRAAELRERAATAKTDDARNDFMYLASLYERMAAMGGSSEDPLDDTP